MGHPSENSLAGGASELVRFLRDTGQRHFFGLPGSSMVSMLYELASTDIDFVPAVHESAAVAMADGYARVAGSACVSVYMMPGMANSLGNLYNAWRDETPLLIMASQQMSSIRSGQTTIGEADLVELVRPYTRYAAEVPGGCPLQSRLTAAWRAAHGPPAGPSFVSLPEDILEGPVPRTQERKSTRILANAPDVDEVVRALATADQPLLVVGGQVRRSGGAQVLEELAKRYGLAVAYETGWNDRLSIAPSHECCVGRLVDEVAQSLERTADVVIAVGCRNVLEAHPRPAPWFAAATFVAHVNADAEKLEAPHTADWVSCCDPASFLSALRRGLDEIPLDESLVERRHRRLAAAQAAKRAVPANPYSAGAFALSDALDHGWLVDESVSASGHVLRALQTRDGGRYVSTTGASLGWGPGAACGVAIASDEPVTCLLGDGAVLFGAQALWTASARSLPITFVVFDNGGYGSTRFFERQYIARLESPQRPPSYLGSDHRSLGPPVGDVIRGFGVPCRTLGPDINPREALLQAWADNEKGPNAVVIPVDFGE